MLFEEKVYAHWMETDHNSSPSAFGSGEHKTEICKLSMY